MVRTDVKTVEGTTIMAGAATEAAAGLLELAMRFGADAEEDTRPTPARVRPRTLARAPLVLAQP